MLLNMTLLWFALCRLLLSHKCVLSVLLLLFHSSSSSLFSFHNVAYKKNKYIIKIKNIILFYLKSIKEAKKCQKRKTKKYNFFFVNVLERKIVHFDKQFCDIFVCVRILFIACALLYLKLLLFIM
jgi:hypothetical protein